MHSAPYASNVVVFMKALPDGAVYFKTRDGSRQYILNLPASAAKARGGDIAMYLRAMLTNKNLKTTPDELNKAASAVISKNTIQHGYSFVYDDDEEESDYLEGHLQHHGILGMKWGVRRYQNSDGSLTDAGKKRYGLGDPKYQRKHGINETENVMKNLVFMRKGTEIAKDNYKFRKSSGNEKEFKTGEAQVKATQNYANFLKDAYNMFDDMIPKGKGKLTGESREKYISYLLNQTVEHLNSPAMQGYVSEGTKIFYKIDTSRGLNDIDFKLDFEYPDQRKIK